MEDGRIDRRTAYLQFLNFVMDEADGIAVTILSFAYHLFGGVTAFKAMLLARNSSSGEEKLHQLFNGGIVLHLGMKMSLPVTFNFISLLLISSLLYYFINRKRLYLAVD